jgi:CheY-like chemotaxis protein
MTKILLIEDVSDTVELVERILISRGYEFVHAPDAETGLQYASGCLIMMGKHWPAGSVMKRRCLRRH